jgi:hypothetical protein
LLPVGRHAVGGEVEELVAKDRVESQLALAIERQIQFSEREQDESQDAFYWDVNPMLNALLMECRVPPERIGTAHLE